MKWYIIILIIIGVLVLIVGGLMMIKQQVTIENEFLDKLEGVVSASGELVSASNLKDLGYSGMEIVSYKVNDLSFTEKDYSTASYDFNSTITKTPTEKYTNGLSTTQDIYITNKLGSKLSVNTSILIQIDYDKITWNRIVFYLKDYPIQKPLKLGSWIDNETGKLITPNIFFDDTYNKRIGYKDVAEQGGYALVYQDNKINYIELIVKDKSVNALSTSKIDPTYYNQSDGFSTSAIGSASPQGITTNKSDIWFLDNADYFVYHTNRTGGNITDGFSTLAIGANNPISITTNGSDFWIVDYTDYFVYHTNRTGGNITDGFPTIDKDHPYGITTNGSDFWITDDADYFVYHTNRTGGNITDGFSTSAIGSNGPSGITTNVSLPGTWGSPTDFWITDYTDIFVYHLSTNEPPPPADTCTYTSGNWAVTCSDNCVISSNAVGTLKASNFSAIGKGNMVLNANISNFTNYLISGGCNVTCAKGCIRI